MRFLFFILILFPFFIQAQISIKGIVKDTDGFPIYAANVYIEDNIDQGTTTDFDGSFTLLIDNKIYQSSNLIITFIGYKEKRINISDLSKEIVNNIILENNESVIPQIEIVANKTISDPYTIESFDKYDIYLNSLSQGDPLRAISSLPASTNTDESANPTLRGSDSDRTRVILNNIPVYRPVRNAQVNGIGNFSLFNTAIVDKQDVYVSNPPLIFGNSSAGLVEIKTIKESEKENTQLSIGLAGIGYFVNDTLNGKMFIQSYGNLQFSGGFKKLNKQSISGLKSFGSIDNGFNYNLKIDNSSSINVFNYFINEKFDSRYTMYNKAFNSIADNTRNFTILNYEKYFKKWNLSVNQGLDFSSVYYNYGARENDNFQATLHSSLLVQYNHSEKHQIKTGVSYEKQHYNFKGKEPYYFFDLDTTFPSIHYDTTLVNNFIESFIFYNFFLKKITFSTAARIGFQIKNSPYLSLQSSLRYVPHWRHSFLFSFGRYNNFSTPYSYNINIALQNSYQFSIDYSHKFSKIKNSFGVYYKLENTDDQFVNNFMSFKKQRIFGLEFQTELALSEHFKFLLNYTYLLPKFLDSNNSWEISPNRLNYFFRTSLSYNNPQIINVNLIYQFRNGMNYFQFNESEYDPLTNNYFPDFQSISVESFKPYHNVSIQLSRYWGLKDKNLVAFFNISNILNLKNESSVYYNLDYSETNFNYLQQRIFYFGIVLGFEK